MKHKRAFQVTHVAAQTKQWLVEAKPQLHWLGQEELGQEEPNQQKMGMMTTVQAAMEVTLDMLFDMGMRVELEQPTLYDFSMMHSVTLYLTQGDIRVEEVWMSVREDGLAYVSSPKEVQAALEEEQRTQGISIPKTLQGIGDVSKRKLRNRKIGNLWQLSQYTVSELVRIVDLGTVAAQALKEWAASQGVILDE